MTRDALEHPDRLVYVSRMERAETDALLRVSSAFHAPELEDELEANQFEVALDRLKLAEDILAATREILDGPAVTTVHLRMAVNRAYYALHHALRALLSADSGYDISGHEETLQGLRNLLKDESKRAACGLKDDRLFKRARAARDNRVVADYSPYGTGRDPRKEKSLEIQWIEITGDSWLAAARHNMDTAKEALGAAWNYFDAHPMTRPEGWKK